MLLTHTKYGEFCIIYMLVMCVIEGLHIKKRRGRKAMSMLQHCVTSFIVSSSNVIVGGADQGVICSTQSTNNQQATTSMDKKQ